MIHWLGEWINQHHLYGLYSMVALCVEFEPKRPEEWAAYLFPLYLIVRLSDPVRRTWSQIPLVRRIYHMRVAQMIKRKSEAMRAFVIEAEKNTREFFGNK